MSPTLNTVDIVVADMQAAIAFYAGGQEPWDAFWGMRYATVTDPDGNGVDLYCPLSEQAAAE